MRALADEGKRELQKLIRDEGKAGQRSLINPLEIVCGVFWPTLLFVAMVRVNISKLRHRYSTFTFFVFTIIPVLVTLYYSRKMWINMRTNLQKVRRWRMVMNVVFWGAIFYAALRGEKLYWRFARSYYQFQDMASYVNISPSSDRGQTYMDAGQVYFKEGSRVEVSKAMAFQEDQVYCVAPIVQEALDAKGKPATATNGASQVGNNGSAVVGGNLGNIPGGNTGKGGLKLPKSGTVDFWAVGMNCCDPSGLNFRCGDSGSHFARAGIRVLRDDTRPFFLMAVQEWTAWLQMPAKHPLFFYWVQDPLLEVDKFWFEARKWWALDTLICLTANLAGTFILHFVFYNLGY